MTPETDLALLATMPEKMRRCIVTGHSLPTDRLIRFVADPHGTVVADLAGKLPGRGVWVTARAEMVEDAARRQLFSRALRQQVVIPELLAEKIDLLLEQKALRALSLAKKAGLVVSGFSKADLAIRSGRVRLLFHAIEAARDGVRKLEQAVRAAAPAAGTEVVIRQIWRSDQMDLALGGHNVIHAAAICGGATSALLGRIRELEQFRT